MPSTVVAAPSVRYVRAREALIPVAESLANWVAGPEPRESDPADWFSPHSKWEEKWDAAFLKSMDALWGEHALSKAG